MNVKLPMMFAPGLKVASHARPWQSARSLPEHANGRAMGLSLPFDKTLARADAKLAHREPAQVEAQTQPIRQDKPADTTPRDEMQSPQESSQEPVQEEAVAVSEPVQEADAPQPEAEAVVEAVDAPVVELAAEIVETLPVEGVIPVETVKPQKTGTDAQAATGDVQSSQPEWQTQATVLPSAEPQADTPQRDDAAPPTPQVPVVPIEPVAATTAESEAVVSSPTEAASPVVAARTESSGSAPAPVVAAPPAVAPASPVAREAAAPQALPLAQADEDGDQVNAARVARGLQSALQQQGGSVTLRLHPPELGFVRIELQMVHGAVSATLQSDAGNVRQLLTQQLAMLRLGLENQGLTVERLNVQALPQMNANQQAGAQSQQHDDARGPADDGRSRGQWASESEEERQRQREERRAARAARGRFADLMVNELA